MSISSRRYSREYIGWAAVASSARARRGDDGPELLRVGGEAHRVGRLDRSTQGLPESKIEGTPRLASLLPRIDRERLKAFEAAGGRCQCERKECDEGHADRCPNEFAPEDRGGADDPDAWQAHHWRARSRGGTDNQANCEIVCVPCHKSTDSYGRPPGKKR
ncbi:HNH endonuclease [Sorangium cellulosum]|uniref:HNH domain-containing protein n=1 Tax=Sorangium cellulosum So0157-2 TaxID=1254432 RepID=S4Y5S6_SORCE|nr:HNH endonuclease signature motif containing protein [Sorangium cellulosum]AGP40762.1 hypothetical protein SCE1572_43515 [Sorangium cellulosum So0157-2]